MSRTAVLILIMWAALAVAATINPPPHHYEHTTQSHS